MFDPLTAGVLLAGWLAFRKQTGNNFGKLTPEREDMYLNAMKHLQDPEKLKILAESFSKEGLTLQAKLLMKRAEWRSRNAEVKERHEVIFQKALLSENPSAVIEVAKAFEGMTATAKAAQLYAHARQLRDKQIPPKAKAEPKAQPKAEPEPEVQMAPADAKVAVPMEAKPMVTNGKGKHVAPVTETSTVQPEGADA